MFLNKLISGFPGQPVLTFAKDRWRRKMLSKANRMEANTIILLFGLENVKRVERGFEPLVTRGAFLNPVDLQRFFEIE